MINITQVTLLPDLTDRFDHTWIFGDLNFRLDISRLHADWLISRKGMYRLLIDMPLTLRGCIKLLTHVTQNTLKLWPLINLVNSCRMVIPHSRVYKRPKLTFLPRTLFLAFGISITHTLVRFKYDVSRTVKQREKPRTRYAHHHSKSSLDEVEDKGHNLESGITVNEEDYDDELEDAISLRSSAWTSNGSKYQIDAAGYGSEHSGDMPLNHTSKLVSHAAAKAKAAWITFINASRDVQANNFPTKQRRKTSAARLGIPPSSVESSQATRATSDQSAASLNPPIRRAVSAKTSMLHRKPEDGVSHPDIDKGVYDSSSKQRVPSW